MSEETVSKWLIAPELVFERSAEVAAQNEVLESEGFLKAKFEFETAFATAFQDAESIVEKYMPMLTDPALTKEELKRLLPAEAEGYGRLHGREGFMASRRDKAKRKASIKAAYDARVSLLRLKKPSSSCLHVSIEQSRGGKTRCKYRDTQIIKGRKSRACRASQP